MASQASRADPSHSITQVLLEATLPVSVKTFVSGQRHSQTPDTVTTNPPSWADYNNEFRIVFARLKQKPSSTRMNADVRKKLLAAALELEKSDEAFKRLKDLNVDEPFYTADDRRADWGYFYVGKGKLAWRVSPPLDEPNIADADTSLCPFHSTLTCPAPPSSLRLSTTWSTASSLAEWWVRSLSSLCSLADLSAVLLGRSKPCTASPCRCRTSLSL